MSENFLSSTSTIIILTTFVSETTILTCRDNSRNTLKHTHTLVLLAL